MINAGTKCWLGNALMVFKKVLGSEATLDDLESADCRQFKTQMQSFLMNTGITKFGIIPMRLLD